MMQRFAFLLLAASVALLSSVVPVEAALLKKRHTNGQRFAKGLLPFLLSGGQGQAVRGDRPFFDI